MVKLVQPSFASGEIAPRLYGRVDISKYSIALRTAKNAIVYPSGGIANRPGTKFVGPAKAHSTNVRLIPFEASSSDTYALEFSNLVQSIGAFTFLKFASIKLLSFKSNLLNFIP